MYRYSPPVSSGGSIGNSEGGMLTCIERRLLEERRMSAEMVSNGLPRTRAYPRHKTIDELFDEQVALTPSTIAVNSAESHLTYQELCERAGCLAREFRRQGVQPGSLVAIAVSRSIDMIVAILAVLKAGAAYLPLDPEFPVERTRLVLQDARPALILTHGRTRTNLPEAGVRVLNLDLLPAAASDWPQESPRTYRVNALTLAYV